MKSNTTEQILVIVIVSTLISAISFLSVATVKVSVFADHSSDSDNDSQTKQMNKCDSTEGTSRSSASAPNDYLASASSSVAVDAAEKGIACNTNADILPTSDD